jgi:hypothetical protein
VLRVSGYLCGKITKIGSTYLAGQGLFPLDEWKALLAGPLDETFYLVIGAADFEYSEAIESFIYREKKFKEGRIGNGSESDSYESGSSKVSWEETVREMASERSSGDNALSFRDIPFHQAGKYTFPSYRAYIQFVLQNCHSRRFFITDKGYIGIAPEEVEVGDQVYICVGAAIPFAFRKIQGECYKHGSEQFQLVGECYVEKTAWHDLRDGSDVPQYFDIV